MGEQPAVQRFVVKVILICYNLAENRRFSFSPATWPRCVSLACMSNGKYWTFVWRVPAACWCGKAGMKAKVLHLSAGAAVALDGGLIRAALSAVRKIVVVCVRRA